jgi:hypothetical protein
LSAMNVAQLQAEAAAVTDQLPPPKDGPPPDAKVSKELRSDAQYRFDTSGVLAGLSATAFTVLLTLTLPHPDTYHELFRTFAAIALALATLGFMVVALSAHSVVRIIKGNDTKEQQEAYAIHEEADGWITLGFCFLFVALLLIALLINVYVGTAAIIWAGIIVCKLSNLRAHVLRRLLDALSRNRNSIVRVTTTVGLLASTALCSAIVVWLAWTLFLAAGWPLNKSLISPVCMQHTRLPGQRSARNTSLGAHLAIHGERLRQACQRHRIGGS